MSLYKWLFGVDRPKKPVIYPFIEPQCNYPADLSPAEKADRILEHRKMIEKCWEADICPVCGHDLCIKTYNIFGDVQIYCNYNAGHFCRHF